MTLLEILYVGQEIYERRAYQRFRDLERTAKKSKKQKGMQDKADRKEAF